MFKHFVLLVLILPAFGNEEETTLLQTHETTKLEGGGDQHADGNQTRPNHFDVIWRPPPAAEVGCTGGWPGSGWRYEQNKVPSSGGWSYAKSEVCDYEGCKGDTNCMGVAWVKGQKGCWRMKQGTTISSKPDWEVCIKDDTTTPMEEMYKVYYSPSCKPLCDKFNHDNHGRGTCDREACADRGYHACKCLSKAEYKEKI